MSEHMRKEDLQEQIRQGYEQLVELVNSLSEEQATTTGVNGVWSVKDNLAHLAVWQNYLLEGLQAIRSGKTPSGFGPDLKAEDEINEHFYQQNKDRSLKEVLADLQEGYQGVLSALENLSEQVLNEPLPWRKEGGAVWESVAGNTYEHYEEHRANILHWLDSVSTN